MALRMKGEKRMKSPLIQNVSIIQEVCVSLVAIDSVKSGSLGAVHKISEERREIHRRV